MIDEAAALDRCDGAGQKHRFGKHFAVSGGEPSIVVSIKSDDDQVVADGFKLALEVSEDSLGYLVVGFTGVGQFVDGEAGQVIDFLHFARLVLLETGQFASKAGGRR